MITDLREKLRNAYNKFIEKYGSMNKARNRNIILNDSHGLVILASVEVKNGSEYTPADILTKSVKGKLEEYKTENVVDALSYCLGIYGRVDLNIISEITDREWPEIINDLGDLIYYNPIKEEWEEASKWLSGNVYDKMIKTEQILNKLKYESSETTG